MISDRADERSAMVRAQISSRGISSSELLRSMGSVPRHLFVPEPWTGQAYEDHPIPIGHGQTISQPYVVARMTELLAPVSGERILEVGTGSGYQAAILATMGAVVVSLERIPAVAEEARVHLHRAGITGVLVIVSDGSAGWASEGPYDGIIITAAAPSIPAVLISQLKPGGRIIAPVGPRHLQEIVRLTCLDGACVEEHFDSVRFVPLIGEYGWDSPGE